MSSCLDIALDEWHIDRSLFQAFVKSNKLNKIKKKSKEYDSIYLVAQTMGIRHKINPQYSWFYLLFKNE